MWALQAEIMATRDFIKEMPGKLTGIIAGSIIYVNAKYAGDLLPSKFQNFATDNMEMIGGILIALSLLNLGVGWYMAATELE